MNIFEHNEICSIMHRLGSTANRTGFFYIITAVTLASEIPERLLLVTKWLYPDVAKLYHTTWPAVERCIRYEITQLWLSDPARFARVLQIPMNRCPTSSQFISVLAAHCKTERVA